MKENSLKHHNKKNYVLTSIANVSNLVEPLNKHVADFDSYTALKIKCLTIMFLNLSPSRKSEKKAWERHSGVTKMATTPLHFTNVRHAR